MFHAHCLVACVQEQWRLKLYSWPPISPARLLIEVVPYPGVGLDGHQAGHIHLLDVMSGGQHYFIGVRLGSKDEREADVKQTLKGNLETDCSDSLSQHFYYSYEITATEDVT